MPETPYQPPARRWFQFRLRTLFVVTAMAAVMFGCVRSGLSWLEASVLIAALAIKIVQVASKSRSDRRRIPCTH